MTIEEVVNFFLDHDLFARYDEVEIGYDIYDSNHCVISTLKDNPSIADCMLKIKQLKDSNFI